MNEETKTDVVNWQLCRICAEENYDIIHIYDEVGINMQLEEKINHYLPITVSEEDCLPLYMCILCIKKLNTTHELIVSCIESNDKFNGLLKLEVKSEVSEEQPEVTGSILGLNKVVVESFQEEDLNCLDNKETCERNVVSKLDVDVVQVIQEQENSQAAELTFGEPHTITVIDNKPQKDWVLIKFDSPPNESCEKEVVEVLESETHNETGSTSPVIICNQFSVQEGVEQLRESYNGTAEIEESCIETSKRKEVLDDVNNINNEPDKVNGFVKEPSRHCSNSEYLNNKLNQNIESETIILQKPININPEDTEEEIVLSCDNEVNVTIENTPSDSNKHFLDKFHSDKNWRLNNTQILQFVSQGHEVNGNNKPETILILNSLKENENLSDVDNYICDVCNVKHSNAAELKAHVCIKTGNEEDVNILSCEYCHNIFEDVNALNDHMQVHSHFISRQDDTIKHLTEQECTNQQINYTSESRPWLCDHCGKRFTHIKNLRVHKRNHLDDSFKKRHKCEVCGKSFRSRFLVRDHMMIHTGERPFLCDRCPKRFTTKMRLKQHTTIHEGIRPFQCSLCSFNSMRRANLVKHYKTHVAFECSICHVYFVSAVSLFNHRRTHSEEELQHSGETRNSDETAVASNFQCSDCGKFLSSKASLDIHRRVHAGIKPFVCVECGKCFSQKPALNYHRRLHTGERPHSCQFCGRGFNSKIGKDNHERVHTGEKPYHCSKCGAGFRCSANLRQHELIHEDVRAFPCLHCEKRFRRREAMQIHMRIHTGERPYSCPICHRTFTQKGDMKKHVRSHSSRTEKHVVCSNCGVIFINKKQWKLHACEMKTIDKNQGTVAIKPEDEVFVREITVVSNDIQEYEEEYQS